MIKARLHKILKGSHGVLPLDVDIQFEQGSFNALFGPSGAGKTSTLRMLSGLLSPDSGKITNHNEVWFDSEKSVNLSAGKRNIGYLFQDLALFPNMSIRQNLQYASGKNPNNALIAELLRLTELESLADQKPDVLSGGQAKRAALVRALAQEPQLLLLDEPFTALDQKLRLEFQDHLLQLHSRFGFSVILVSHDLPEVCKLAAHVWVLDNGSIIKSGAPTVVFGLDRSDKQVTVLAQVIAKTATGLIVSANGQQFEIKTDHTNDKYALGSWVPVGLPTDSAILLESKK